MLELKGVSKCYKMGNEDLYVLRDINLKINQGEFVAIMGPSGSGKSTLLNILGLLDEPSGGEYNVFGRDITTYSEEEVTNLRSQIIGFIFQQYHLLKKTTAEDNVLLPHMYFKSKEAKTPHEVLKIVGLEDRIHHKTNELSGGQQQRVAIARSLINSPKILFADEPTGNLDSKSEKEILDIISSLHKKGMSVLMVTHEESVAEYADRVIRLKDGRIVSDTKPVTQLAPSSLEFNEPQRIDFNFIKKNIKMASLNILSNKIRSILSMLGILIGVSSVIAMLAIGTGAQDSIDEQFANLGANALIITPGPDRFSPNISSSNKIIQFDEEDTKKIKASVTTVKMQHHLFKDKFAQSIKIKIILEDFLASIKTIKMLTMLK